MKTAIPRAFPGECVPVVMAADEGYILPLCVALATLAQHASPARRYDIVILCIGRAQELLLPLLPSFCSNNISARAVNLSSLHSFHTSNHISLASYNRLYIPELMPEYDKVLYLDCDIIVHADVAELYDIELGDNYLAACEDYYLTQGTSPYVPQALAELRKQGCPIEGHINAGILVMNLAALRRDNMQPRMLECAAAQAHYYHDQCVLNITCQGRILPLPLEWNMCVADSLGRDVMSDWHHDTLHRLLRSGEYKIVHYSCWAKPWKHLQRPLAELWWREASGVSSPAVKRLLFFPYAKWLVLRIVTICLPKTIQSKVLRRLSPAFHWNP